ARRAIPWPDHSPGALNAWLLFVTSRAPSWQNPLVTWRELPPTLGTPHEGFFYPDPLGFWAEVRRWSVVLFGLIEPGWDAAEALSLTALVHIGDDPVRLTRVLTLLRPRAVLFLDEEAWSRSSLPAEQTSRHHIPDPHRPGQVYEGHWGRDPAGRALGKSPQHPAANRLYRAEDMDAFLRAAPLQEAARAG
ncbi:MAG: hypothetical protein C4289_09065, partial [Chloroflexota bacterium]